MFGLYAAESEMAGRAVGGEMEGQSEAPFGFGALWRAYLSCRRRKRHTRNTQRYEIRLLDNLMETAQALQMAAWRPSRTLCFVTERPKAREIHAADFGDRIVHHLLVPRLEARFEPIFIHDSYSNRRGKGTHMAVERLQTFMRQVTKNGNQAAYYLQLDIRNFFNTIDRRILYRIIRRRLAPGAQPVDEPTRQLLWLTRVILTGNAGENAVQRGAPAIFERVPAHKRLRNAPPGKGLPIGNLTSQFFANVYLDRLDQFVKHTLKCRHYLRYVDDFILLHESADQLAAWRERITKFLTDELELTLRDNGKLRPVSDGSDFLGYIVRPDYLLVRRRVIGALREKLDAFHRQLTAKTGESLRLDPAVREALRATLASYLGHFSHASAFNLTQSLWRRYPWLGEIIVMSPEGRLVPLWEPACVTSLLGQWHKRQESGIRFSSSGANYCPLTTDSVIIKPASNAGCCVSSGGPFPHPLSNPARNFAHEISLSCFRPVPHGLCFDGAAVRLPGSRRAHHADDRFHRQP